MSPRKHHWIHRTSKTRVWQHGAFVHGYPQGRGAHASPVTVAALDEQVVFHVLLPADGAGD